MIPSAPVKRTILLVQTWAETCRVSIPIYHLAKPRLKSSQPACQSSAQSVTPHFLRSAGWLQPYSHDVAACFALGGPGKRGWMLPCSEQLGRRLAVLQTASSHSRLNFLQQEHQAQLSRIFLSPCSCSSWASPPFFITSPGRTDLFSSTAMANSLSACTAEKP